MTTQDSDNKPKPTVCQHGEHIGHAYWLHDGHGIPLAKVCNHCKATVVKRYRPDIFSTYDAEEPIEPNY